MADDVTVRFGADTSDLEDGLSELRGALAGVTPELKKLSEGIGEAAQRTTPAASAFSQMGRGINDGLTASLGPASAALTKLGSDAEEQARLVKTQLDGEIRVLQEQLATKKTIYDGEAQLKRISEGEKISLVREATEEEFQAQRALLEQEAELDGLSLQQKQQALNRLATLEASHERQMLQLAYRSAEEQDRIWQDVGNKMGHAMSSSILLLMQHTTSFREAQRQMAVSVVGYFLDMGTRWVASFAATIARNVATHVLGEETMTAATELGTAQRTASAASGAVAESAEKAEAVVRSILASSAEAFAGVFGFLAPLLGPAAAGPAAAAEATVASAASIASFDIGAWSVPQDQLALVHKNELVMTATQGEAFRNLIANGATAGVSAPQVHAPVNFNIQALDAQGVATFLQGNGRAIMKAMAAHVRDGAHLGMKGLNPA